MSTTSFAVVGVASLTSLLLSYFIYQKAAKEPSETQKKRSKRELKRALRSARAARTQNQERIVGANQGLRNQTVYRGMGDEFDLSQNQIYQGFN